QFPAGELQARERIAAEPGQDEIAPGDDDGEEEAVLDVQLEVVLRPDRAPRRARPRMRDQVDVDAVGNRLEGCRERPQERDEEHGCDREDHDVEEGLAGDRASRTPGDERLGGGDGGLKRHAASCRPTVNRCTRVSVKMMTKRTTPAAAAFPKSKFENASR